MIDPTVTTPEELAFHVSGYGARLADSLEGGNPGGRSAANYPLTELGMAVKHAAQAIEYLRLGGVAVAADARVGTAERADLAALAAELGPLMRRLDNIGTRIAQSGT